MAKLSKADLIKRVDEYRKIYPKDKLFYTEDGNVFLNKNAAADHARKTKQKVAESEPEKAKSTTTKTGMSKEDAEKKLKGLELTDETDENTCIELIKALNLETASDKKDDLLVALEEYKNTLK